MLVPTLLGVFGPLEVFTVIPRLRAPDARDSLLPRVKEALDSPRLDNLVGLDTGISGDARLDIVSVGQRIGDY